MVLVIGYSRKNPNMRGWRHGIPRGTEEKACGNCVGLGFWPWNF